MAGWVLDFNRNGGEGRKWAHTRGVGNHKKSPVPSYETQTGVEKRETCQRRTTLTQRIGGQQTGGRIMKEAFIIALASPIAR